MPTNVTDISEPINQQKQQHNINKKISYYTPLKNDPTHIKSVFSTCPYILFDCDGLILDTEPIYSKVALLGINHFLGGRGRVDSFPMDLKLKIMGGTKTQVSKEMAEFINSRLNSENLKITWEDWSNHTTPLETIQFSLGCPLMPGIRELLEFVKVKMELPLAVATSSSRQTFYIKSGPHSQLFSLFNSITCGDDPDFSIPNTLERPIVKGKPHPSIFLTAKYHLNSSGDGIVLEDSPNGVVAALRSGHSCIWVPSVGDADFGLIDDLIKITCDIPSGLWVYRADSLNEINEILK